MAILNIPDLDPTAETALNLRASRNGRSAEREARLILEQAVSIDIVENEREIDLAEAIRRRFADLGGADDLADVLQKLDRDPPTSDR